MIRPSLLVLAMCQGCTSTESPPAKAETAKVEPPKVESPKVEPPKVEPPKPVAAAFVAGERTHILLQRHDDTTARAQVLAVTLEGAVVGGEVDHTAMAMPYWEGHFVAVAGHGGDKDWATGESDGKGFRVVLRQIGEAATKDVPVPHAPAAIHVAGPTVIVGAGPTVGSISLMGPSPSWSLAREREDMHGKAFDGFGPSARRLPTRWRRRCRWCSWKTCSSMQRSARASRKRRWPGSARRGKLDYEYGDAPDTRRASRRFGSWHGGARPRR